MPQTRSRTRKESAQPEVTLADEQRALRRARRSEKSKVESSSAGQLDESETTAVDTIADMPKHSAKEEGISCKVERDSSTTPMIIGSPPKESVKTLPSTLAKVVDSSAQTSEATDVFALENFHLKVRKGEALDCYFKSKGFFGLSIEEKEEIYKKYNSSVVSFRERALSKMNAEERARFQKDAKDLRSRIYMKLKRHREKLYNAAEKKVQSGASKNAEQLEPRVLSILKGMAFEDILQEGDKFTTYKEVKLRTQEYFNVHGYVPRVANVAKNRYVTFRVLGSTGKEDTSNRVSYTYNLNSRQWKCTHAFLAESIEVDNSSIEKGKSCPYDKEFLIPIVARFNSEMGKERLSAKESRF